MTLSLGDEGAEHFAGLLAEEEVTGLSKLFDGLSSDRPGLRLSPSAVSGLPAVGRVTAMIGNILAKPAWPVRALLFDKRDGGNWSLGWHQDRTIEVVERRDVKGFSAWTTKQGRQHVAPPIEILERMTTVRIHLDAVDAENAPLLIVPGSHKLGLVREEEIGAIVVERGSFSCLAKVGDIWCYSTPILHASSRASPGRRRRVLQLDYASETLPGGLSWAASA